MELLLLLPTRNEVKDLELEYWASAHKSESVVLCRYSMQCISESTLYASS